MATTQIKITDIGTGMGDGAEFIVFSKGSNEEVNTLLDTLNSVRFIVAGVVE